MARNPRIDELLRGCAHSAVHLEMRDGYMRSDPMFVAWQQGQHPDPDDRDAWWDSWWQLTADIVASGVQMQRARVVSEPISDYIRFEYDVTFMNIAAGEAVRWLPRRRASDLALPGNDFWVFDGHTVMINHFSGDGEGAGQEFSTDPALIKLCESAFQTVWERAVPHAEYHPS
ncbi:hypothetical protein GCM10022255_111130 [Dactylosporangium darangshiense]|uniref:DUF6879 domain-containing protein n=1 Tax=Dactylosporangium darangshiense TaxID=579108 RepID=A0ABP8DUQ3_9ACTN